MAVYVLNVEYTKTNAFEIDTVHSRVILHSRKPEDVKEVTI